VLPTQHITPDWLLAVLRRRAWYVAIPFVAVAAGAAMYAESLPNLYRSTAVVLVTPPQLPAAVVRPMVTMPLSERLPMLQQEVLSRARLERIVLDYDLYAEQRAEGMMEDIVTQMRKDISVSVARSARRAEGASFTLSYTSEEPRTAHRVAERLVGLFVDENARQRETIAEGTDQFLSAEVETSRLRLEETEKKLEAYKKLYGSELPEQMQANVTGLQHAQAQVQTLNESISRDRTELLLVQRELSDASDYGAAAAAGGDGASDGTGAMATPYDDALAKARGTQEALELRLTPDHPDVVRQRRVVEELEGRVREAQLNRPVSPSTPVTAARLTPAEMARRNRVAELRQREQLLAQQVASKQRDVQARQAQASAYQSRLDAAPSREAELIGLVRDYETLKQRYNTLLMRSEEAKVAANMERRQISEQFRIADPPRVPEVPYSPDRLRITLVGALGGLALGVLLVGLMEYRDTTFRTDDDIVSALALPVVAVVPDLLSSAERRERRRRRWMLSTSGVAVVAVTCAVLLWKYGL
jgi:polysaccharide chain length determinant protein (PEP-CTERM system associated)